MRTNWKIKAGVNPHWDDTHNQANVNGCLECPTHRRLSPSDTHRNPQHRPPANQIIPSICQLHASMYVHRGDSQIPYGLSVAVGQIADKRCIWVCLSEACTENSDMCAEAPQHDTSRTRDRNVRTGLKHSFVRLQLCCDRDTEKICSSNMKVCVCVFSPPSVPSLALLYTFWPPDRPVCPNLLKLCYCM